MYRWCIGFYLGGRSYAEQHGADVLDVGHPASIFVPNLTIVGLVLGGISLSLIALGLLASTLRNMRRGDLTIDVEIRKRTRHHLISSSKTSSPSSHRQGEDATSSTRGARFFWVPMSCSLGGAPQKPEEAKTTLGNARAEHRGAIVPWPAWDNPYDQGSWLNNARVLLGYVRRFPRSCDRF